MLQQLFDGVEIVCIDKKFYVKLRSKVSGEWTLYTEGDITGMLNTERGRLEKYEIKNSIAAIERTKKRIEGWETVLKLLQHEKEAAA